MYKPDRNIPITAIPCFSLQRMRKRLTFLDARRVLDWSRPTISRSGRFDSRSNLPKQTNEACRISRRPGSERKIRSIHEDSLSDSQAYSPQNQEGRTSKPSQKTAFRQELERHFRPRSCLRLARRFIFPGEFGIGQTVSGNSTHCLCESHRIRNLLSVLILAMIETKCLLINVAKQMERLYADVGSAEPAFQQTPEVLKPLCVNCT